MDSARSPRVLIGSQAAGCTEDHTQPDSLMNRSVRGGLHSHHGLETITPPSAELAPRSTARLPEPRSAAGRGCHARSSTPKARTLLYLIN